jgi:hypothetical protein
MLNSMSMDSYDSTIDNGIDCAGGKLHDTANDSSMLRLDDNIGMISDSPTFHRRSGTVDQQHIYPNEEETPITANGKRSYDVNTRNTDIPTAQHRSNNDSIDDPSPIRATILHLPASLNVTSRNQNDHHNTNHPSFNSTLSSDIITLNKLSGCDDHDISSQPSDEIMGDSMEQDLQGFADELDRIKRDIGLSSFQSKNDDSSNRSRNVLGPPHQPKTTSNPSNRYLLHTRVPSDEFVDNDILPSISPTTATVAVTSDDITTSRLNSNTIKTGRNRR